MNQLTNQTYYSNLPNKLQGSHTARNQVNFNELNIDQGPLDLSLNQIKINHPKDRNSKPIDDSKHYSTVAPGSELNRNGVGFGGQLTSKIGKLKDPKSNINQEIYVRKEYKTKRYDTKKPSSMARVNNSNLPLVPEKKEATSPEPIQIIRGFKAGTEIAQSARLSVELQKLLQPTNQNVQDFIVRTSESRESKPTHGRIGSSEHGRNMNSVHPILDNANSYGDKPYETAVMRNKSKDKRYDLTQNKLSQAKTSVPQITGHQLQPINRVENAMNQSLLSPSNPNNNPVKKRVDQEMVPLSSINGREPYLHQKSLNQRKVSVNSVGPKVVNIGGASLFKQSSSSPINKHKELTEFLSNSINCNQAFNIVEKSGTQEGNKRRLDLIEEGKEIQNVISSATGIEMNRRDRMLLVNQPGGLNNNAFGQVQSQIPSAEVSVNDGDRTFDHMNGLGINNGLSGHPSGQYSLKEIVSSNNNSILQQTTVETKNTPGSISNTSMNQGGRILTESSLPNPQSSAATPQLSMRDKSQQRGQYRTKIAPSGSFHQISSTENQISTQLNSNNSNTQMSVAAKAGEMQIFSNDVYQTAGVPKHRRQISGININRQNGSNRQFSIAESNAHQSFINGDSPEVGSNQIQNRILQNNYEDENGQVNRANQHQTYGEYVARKSRMQEDHLQGRSQSNNQGQLNFEDLKQMYGITSENRNIQQNGIQTSSRDGNGQNGNMQNMQNSSNKGQLFQCQIKGLQTQNQTNHQNSEHQLQIQIQQSLPPSGEYQSHHKTTDGSNYTPTAMRNSTEGGKHYKKFEDFYERNGSIDRQMEINSDMNRQARSIGAPQASKLGQIRGALQNQVLNGSQERNDHFPAKITTSKERQPRKNLLQHQMKKPPPGSIPWTQPLNIAGEQLKISLTGTRCPGQNLYQEQQRQRDQQFKESAYASVSGQYSTNSSNVGSMNQRNLIKNQMGLDASASFSIQGQQQNHFVSQPLNQQAPQSYGTQNPNDFLQQQLGMMGSPKNANPFAAENVGGHSRVYSYHFIYEYLFVQVSEQQYQQEYMPRIRLRKNYHSEMNVLKEQESDDSAERNKFQPHVEGNKLQLSPHARSNRKPPEFSMNQGEDKEEEQIKNESTNRSKSVSSLHDKQPEESKQAQKKKLPEVFKIFENALQSTQYEGLKLLLPENIKQTYAEYVEQHPDENLQNTSDMTNDECLQNFMSDVAVAFTDKNKRFKVTVKKKYINDILMGSKGAQNLAQQVVILVTNNDAMALHSAKKIRKAKKQIQMDLDSDDEAQVADSEATELQKIPGQKTPQVTSNKSKAAQIIATRRGYESENEAKSLNSTTTSSTFPNFKATAQTGNQANTPKNPRKMSTRSLSQIPKSVRINRKTDDVNGKDKEFMTISVDDIANHYSEKYAPTKIKVVQKVEANLKHIGHPINRMLADYNEFTKLVFRTRVTEQRAMQNIPYAIKLARRLGIQVTRNQLLPATLKVRENSNAIKEKIIIHMCKVMNKENTFQPEENIAGSLYNKSVNQNTLEYMALCKEKLAIYDQQKSLASHYKCFIGKGNNSMLIRTLFKSRYWWLLHDKEEPLIVNFMWTQLKKASIMGSLKCKLVNSKDKQAVKETGSNLATPNSKLKKRKVSSANSRSPEPGSDSNEKAIKLNPEPVTNFNEDQKSPHAKVEKEEKKEQTIAQIRNQPSKIETYPWKLYNKIEDNYHLSNKKALLLNMRAYYESIREDVFDSLPVTFHVKEGVTDPNFTEFRDYYENRQDNNQLNMWIIKPGENTNRGQGIQVAKEFSEIKRIIEESTKSKKRTCIIQKYITNPLLYNRRKFDIRTYAMGTSINGNFKGYYYQEGYIRTSCREFNLHNIHNRMIHLTNDAVQKKCEDYGKFEPGNKLSYTEFQNYLDKNYSSMNVCFERDILPQFKKLTTDCFRATMGKMDPSKRVNTFEVYGLDFMLDENFKVYLIEVNTNPCLELASPLLARLIPSMLENSLRLAVDPLFPPPENFSQRKHVVNELCPENKYDLVFDERIDGPELCELYREKENVIVELNEEELSDSEEFDDEDE